MEANALWGDRLSKFTPKNYLYIPTVNLDFFTSPLDDFATTFKPGVLCNPISYGGLFYSKNFSRIPNVLLAGRKENLVRVVVIIGMYQTSYGKGGGGVSLHYPCMYALCWIMNESYHGLYVANFSTR